MTEERTTDSEIKELLHIPKIKKIISRTVTIVIIILTFSMPLVIGKKCHNYFTICVVTVI
jgi:hypothetical protein